MNSLYSSLLRKLTVLFVAIPGMLLAQTQTPVVLSPANNATGLPFSFTITIADSSTGNDALDPDEINIEVADTSDFYSGTFLAVSPTITRAINTPANYTYTISGLQPATRYYIRGNSSKNDVGEFVTIRTASQTVDSTVMLTVVNGGLASNPTGTIRNSAYANLFTITLQINRLVANATNYEWQFDSVSSAFANISDTIISTNVASRNITFETTWSNFRSGQVYFVRVRGRNSTSRGPWGNVMRFVNALHPTSYTAPLTTIDRTKFKIWTQTVSRATDYIFQVDDDPTFATPHTLVAPFLALNSTHPGVTGTVFRANYTIGNGRAFNYISGLTPGTRYYIRTRGSNTRQTGYWRLAGFVDVLPVLTSGFSNITNLATAQTTALTFIFNDHYSYTESSWDFQVSLNSNFSSPLVNRSGVTVRTQYVSGLAYNSTYYARVRSNVAVSPFVSPWVSIQFSTKSQPTISISAPTMNSIWQSSGAYAYSTWESGVSQYEWQIEKLNAPTSTFSKTTTSNSSNFPTYLVRGNQYRIRVRGYVVDQSITGSWSPYVIFSLSPPATPFATPVARTSNTFETNLPTPILELAGYPNPFHSTINLRMPKGTTAITVLDVQGRIVEQNTSPANDAPLGASWPAGIYTLIADTETGTERLRIVKQQ
jgi:hypothetical protein